MEQMIAESTPIAVVTSQDLNELFVGCEADGDCD